MIDDTVLARCHELVWGARSVFARDLSRIRLAAHAPVGRVEVEHTPAGCEPCAPGIVAEAAEFGCTESQTASGNYARY